MLKFIAILTGCSLALAVSVQAAQPEDPNKKPAQKPKTVQKQQVAPKQHTAPTIHAQTVHPQQTTNPVHTKVNTNANKQVHTNASNKVDTNANADVNTKVKTKANTNVSKNQVNTPSTVQSNKLPAVQSNKLPAVQSNKSPAINKQIVQKFHAEHPNFRAKPNTAITSAHFNPNYRIQAAQNWNGTQYNAFRSYQPQWHDRGWWGSHHHSLSLIGGGWYYWDSGYWYPAWGYDDSAAYYPYDGPIYVGHHARPFDQVVADVQSVLQEQGYYHGEVDGLVGPLTQEALAAYQSAQGLPPTAAVDEPTLESLDLG
jgi:hypothetical protein